MAHRGISPIEPGADYLEEGIARLRAAKSVLGGLLAKTFQSIGARFLVLGSAIASIDARTVELEKRDNINWPALDERLETIETSARETDDMLRNSLLRERTRDEELASVRRLAELAPGGFQDRLDALEKRVGELEAEWTDHRIRVGLRDNRTTAVLLRAAVDILEPPVRVRTTPDLADYFRRRERPKADGIEP